MSDTLIQNSLAYKRTDGASYTCLLRCLKHFINISEEDKIYICSQQVILWRLWTRFSVRELLQQFGGCFLSLFSLSVFFNLRWLWVVSQSSLGMFMFQRHSKICISWGHTKYVGLLPVEFWGIIVYYQRSRVIIASVFLLSFKCRRVLFPMSWSSMSTSILR